MLRQGGAMGVAKEREVLVILLSSIKCDAKNDSSLEKKNPRGQKKAHGAYREISLVQVGHNTCAHM